MTTQPEKHEHPGTYIRKHVIPSGMSVTQAARLLVVGRPALSNLLNSRSSLSPSMAVRLEKAFGADRQKLLDLQAAFDRQNRHAKEKTISARTYVPSFLTIKARQIQEWAENNHDARSLLAVLLRKLVQSTGHDLRQVDFPGYDNSERRGWDGLMDAGAATPWIPEDKSGWEFGVSKNPKGKAENDYAARLASVPSADDRAEYTFVFVTPREWDGKTEWARNKNANGDWKAVRAFDANDLEQWLEMSIPAQMWLAEQLGLPVDGFETLDQCWKKWEDASEPKTTPALFEPSIAAHRDTFKQWLEKPSEGPFTVAADSKDEALAFLACLFLDIAPGSKDLACVFKSAATLRTLAASSAPFIPIVHTEDAERELAAVYRRLHCIVVRPRNAVDSKPDIALDLLNREAFEKALAVIGIKGDDADRLARESGRSPTILRRRLSEIPAIKTPAWAADAQIAKNLIPMALVGAWHAKSNADRKVESVLADTPYEKIEENIARLLIFDDSPVWSVGEYRGVASKIDALFAISRYVTEANINDFLRLAGKVLSESDPALELPEDQRWAAAVYDKVRNHSGALREGICETLVILSVHGNNLFQERLGIDVEHLVSMLIRSLLTPLSLEKLLTHDKDLPHYAEAAPDEFLRLLEADLKEDQPVVLGLLKPVESPFGRCPRTGLLWALECLAWQHLGRVNLILGRLSRTIVNDNVTNKPIASLAATYRAWVPQTAASLKERIKSLKSLTRRFPDIGWQICVAQLNAGPQMGMYSYRPRWRNDASGAGGFSTRQEINEFRLRALDLALAWSDHDQKTLGDLVERLSGIPLEYHSQVWNLVEKWADSNPDDLSIAELRERIRQPASTRRGRRCGLEGTTKDRSRMAYEKLRPHNPAIRHAWLFARHWIHPSDDEFEEEDFDPSSYQEKIDELRVQAMDEIWAGRGFEGVTALLSRSDASDSIGASLGKIICTATARADFLWQCLSTAADLERQIDGCMQGFLTVVGNESLEAILTTVAEGANPDWTARVFRCAPFNQTTWCLLRRYGGAIQKKYWQEVVPQWRPHSEEERAEIIDHLLEAKRPLAAFHAVHLDWQKVETSRLKRLLLDVATVEAAPADWYRPDGYHISQALASLDSRPGVSQEEMAQLEFMYIGALEHSEHGIPNLERQIAESPILFVQALAIVFKRNDNGHDPMEWRIEDPDRRSNLAVGAYRLLDRVARIPGTHQNGKIHAETLLNWIVEARRLCAEYGRSEMGDQKIGQLLSRSPADEDGSWPCLAVSEAMERIASEQMGRGFNIGVYNGRGLHDFGEGGVQERGLADKYRNWAELRAFDYPYVSSVLESIAAGYDREAGWQDTRVKVEKRLEH